MRKISITIFLLVLYAFESCDTNEYKRVEGCHLDDMKIKGDVVKVETIVQSTMPLTELFAKAYNPQYIYSLYDGNFSIDFDNKGNLKHSIGYGIDGEVLFDVNHNNSKDDANYSPGITIGPNISFNIDKINTITSESGDVVENKYYEGDKLIWTQKVIYNKEGLVDTITKYYDHLSLSIIPDLIVNTPSDTTIYNYLLPDENGNYTEVDVVYKGVLPKHNHSYKIKRQFTYITDKVKPSLISQLKDYNRITPDTSNHFDRIRLGKYGYIRIPHYMVVRESYDNKENAALPVGTQSRLHYLFSSVYDDNDAYASFSVSLSPDDGSGSYDDLTAKELAFDEKTDKTMEELFTSIMEQGNTYVLKWLPYSFSTIGGHRAMRLRYYRYGKGSPTPVYCEIYNIPMSDGKVISFIYSFQSNLDYKFRSDFNQSIESIVFTFKPSINDKWKSPIDSNSDNKSVNDNYNRLFAIGGILLLAFFVFLIPLPSRNRQNDAGYLGIAFAFLFPPIGVLLFFVQKKSVNNPSAYLYASLVGLIFLFVNLLFNL